MFRFFRRSKPEALSETSMGLDAEIVGEFLNRISSHLESGLPPQNVSALEAWVNATKPDRERSRSLDVVHDGKPTRVAITVFMDDIDAPDLEFRTSESLIEVIENEYEALCEERDM